jgi:hypothetical protein
MRLLIESERVESDAYPGAIFQCFNVTTRLEIFSENVDRTSFKFVPMGSHIYEAFQRVATRSEGSVRGFHGDLAGIGSPGISYVVNSMISAVRN